MRQLWRACGGDFGAHNCGLGLFKKFEGIPRAMMAEGRVVLIADGLATEISVVLTCWMGADHGLRMRSPMPRGYGREGRKSNAPSSCERAISDD